MSCGMVLLGGGGARGAVCRVVCIVVVLAEVRCRVSCGIVLFGAVVDGVVKVVVLCYQYSGVDVFILFIFDSILFFDCVRMPRSGCIL